MSGMVMIRRLLRLSPEQTATIHILMYGGTVDEHWVMQALSDLDPSKVMFADPIEF